MLLSRHTRRRDFITLLGGAAAAWPLAAHAQQGERMRRIGVLMGYAESDLEAQAWVAAFREGLQKLGWAEGRNIRIDLRWAAADGLAQPGGNATGFMMFEYSLSGKWLELLKEVAPGLPRAAVLRESRLPAGIG
jgi:putative ABC transport system substrate-binding protein